MGMQLSSVLCLLASSMLNITFNFLSAVLALDVMPATYKPTPVGPRRHRNSTGDIDPTGAGSVLLVGPHSISFLPKVADMSDPACHVEPYDAPAVTFQDFPPYDEKLATVYRYRQQRSVNLGSWSAQ